MRQNKWAAIKASIFILFLGLSGWFSPSRSELHSQGQPALAKTEAELLQMFARAQDCASCHSRAHDEWENSYHAKAMVAIITPFTKYIKEIEKEKGRFPTKSELLACIDCHAPTLRYASEEFVQRVGRWVVEDKKEELKKYNVDCISCHSILAAGHPEKNVYYGPIEDPLKTDAHQSRFSAKMKGAELCASCHQAYKSEVAEVHCSAVFESWKASAVSATKNCQDCHMKARDGKAVELSNAPMRVVHSHEMGGGHSLAMLQEAVRMSLDAKRAGRTINVTVDLTNIAGHRIPDQ